jgi:hypothetical protein
MEMRSIFRDCVTLSIDPVLDTGRDVIRQKKKTLRASPSGVKPPQKKRWIEKCKFLNRRRIPRREKNIQLTKGCAQSIYRPSRRWEESQLHPKQFGAGFF